MKEASPVAMEGEAQQVCRAALQDAIESCTECGVCARRCEVLAESGTGNIADLARACLSSPADERAVLAVRRCCMCAACTTCCPAGIDAREVFSRTRELLACTGVIGQEGFESTQVDREWHIFSVYRAVYGIFYNDLPHLTEARNIGADTLFFPGCTLASYAPELARQVFAYLGEVGITAVFDEGCCGSPLRSAGRGQRLRAFKDALVQNIVDAGIRRIVTVCPGCRDELAEALTGAQVELLGLPEVLARQGCCIAAGDVCRAAGLADDTALRVALFDSCHDRDGRFGHPLRSMFEQGILCELPHNGADALCCGASGAVSLVDPDLCERRAHRILQDEVGSVRANVLVTDCPTCSYTFAAQQRSDGHAGVVCLNYLELLFPAAFDWKGVFERLEGMWTGEYGAWVCQQLL